jgi:hypothetical protein
MSDLYYQVKVDNIQVGDLIKDEKEKDKLVEILEKKGQKPIVEVKQYLKSEKLETENKNYLK